MTFSIIFFDLTTMWLPYFFIKMTSILSILSKSILGIKDVFNHRLCMLRNRKISAPSWHFSLLFEVKPVLNID